MTLSSMSTILGKLYCTALHYTKLYDAILHYTKLPQRCQGALYRI